eukprot:11557767-Heterocapsa_arctica.AAC.1
MSSRARPSDLSPIQRVYLRRMPPKHRGAKSQKRRQRERPIQIPGNAGTPWERYSERPVREQAFVLPVYRDDWEIWICRLVSSRLR